MVRLAVAPREVRKGGVGVEARARCDGLLEAQQFLWIYLWIYLWILDRHDEAPTFVVFQISRNQTTPKLNITFKIMYIGAASQNHSVGSGNE